MFKAFPDMSEFNLYQIFTSRLNWLAIPYMVTGVLGNLLTGERRSATDLELVIDLSPNKVEPFSKAFPANEFYCPPKDVILVEIARSERSHFNLIHHESKFMADVYVSGQDELNLWGLKNRKHMPLDGYELWLAPIEYDILRKLEYYRKGKSEKHLRDISSMLALISDQIDFPALNERIDHMLLGKEWAIAEKFKLS